MNNTTRHTFETLSYDEDKNFKEVLDGFKVHSLSYLIKQIKKQEKNK